MPELKIIALAEINEFKTERVGFIEADAMEHFYLRLDPIGVDGINRIGWYSTLMGDPVFGFQLVTDDDQWERLEAEYQRGKKLKGL